MADQSVVNVRVNVYGNRSYGEIGGPGGTEADEHELADLQALGIDKPWRSPHGAAIIFNKTKEGEWYVISAAISCNDVWSLGHPATPYIEFRYRNGQWVRVPMSAERIGEKANLMFIDTTQHGHYTLGQKRSIRGGQGPIGEYDQIVANWRDNC